MTEEQVQKVTKWIDARPKEPPKYEAMIDDMLCVIERRDHYDHWDWRVDFPRELHNKMYALHASGSALTRAQAESWCELVAKHARSIINARPTRDNGYRDDRG